MAKRRRVAQSNPDRQDARTTGPTGARRPRPSAAVLVGGGVLLIVAIMVAVKFAMPHVLQPESAGPVPPAVLHAVESVPQPVAAAIGPGTARGLFTPIDAPTLRGQGGLPRIIYVGSEYCPYCAAVRWPLVVALSRFGRFQGLQLSHSAVDDVFPGTVTVTFHRSSYQSAYLVFSPVERESNVGANGRYVPLESLDPVESQVFSKYDAPPYVPAGDALAIPFIDFANRFLFAGSSFSPGLLKGLSAAEIAARLSDPGSDVARAVIGSANDLTAVICVLTADAPSSVCRDPAIQLIERRFSTASH